MTRILVIGGAGYIGSHTVRLLLQHGHDLRVYDNLSQGHRESVPKGLLFQGDLADADRLDHLLMEHRTEAVIHFAGATLVGESMTNPGKFYINNIVHAVTLLERMRRHGVQRIVFSSTCATYGLPEKTPITEETPQNPINPYGTTKLMVEKALADYSHAYGLGYTALRYFNASGAAPDGTIGEDHTPETHLIPLVLQTILGKREQLTIHGTDYPTPDGTCVRDYIHVDDLAEAHRLALATIEPGKGRQYNLGIGHGYSVRDVIRVCEEVTGKKVKLTEGPRRPGDPPVLVAAADKAKRELGWVPQYTDLRPIVETAWNWHKGHPNGYNG